MTTTTLRKNQIGLALLETAVLLLPAISLVTALVFLGSYFTKLIRLQTWAQSQARQMASKTLWVHAGNQDFYLYPRMNSTDLTHFQPELDSLAERMVAEFETLQVCPPDICRRHLAFALATYDINMRDGSSSADYVRPGSECASENPPDTCRLFSRQAGNLDEQPFQNASDLFSRLLRPQTIAAAGSLALPSGLHASQAAQAYGSYRVGGHGEADQYWFERNFIRKTSLIGFRAAVDLSYTPEGRTVCFLTSASAACFANPVPHHLRRIASRWAFAAPKKQL